MKASELEEILESGIQRWGDFEIYFETDPDDPEGLSFKDAYISMRQKKETGEKVLILSIP